MKYLFCYDISNPKSLAEISKVLGQKGFRVQKSFFCCELEKDEAEYLFALISKVINNKTDRLALFAICEKCFDGLMHFGKEKLLMFQEYLVL